MDEVYRGLKKRRQQHQEACFCCLLKAEAASVLCNANSSLFKTMHSSLIETGDTIRKRYVRRSL